MEGRREGLKLEERKKNQNLLAFTGAAALFSIALSFAITAFNSHRGKRNTKGHPSSKIRVTLSGSEIIKLADHVIAKSKEVHDAVASVPLNKATHMNVVAPLAELEAQQFPLIQSCVIQKLVSNSEDVRNTSAEAERRIDAHNLACSKREDVYRVIKAHAMREERKNSEVSMYVQSLVRGFEQNGLNLAQSKREEVQRLKVLIDDLSLQYIQNLNDDNTFLLLSEIELDGVPLEFLNTLCKAGDGKLKLMLKSQHVSPVLDFCKVGRTRKMAAVAYGKRCADANFYLLGRLVQLRHKFARLLGYSNYADYAVHSRMAQSSSKIFEFLEDISDGLNDLAARELSMLKDLKKKDEGEAPFGMEDVLYYVKKVEEEQFDLDLKVVKEYFPINLVLTGTFKIFQDLFGLQFNEICKTEVWHSDVRLFSVFDLSSNELSGYFYLDMYARNGKYGHTCVVALQNSSLSSNIERQMPVALLIAQFEKPVDGKTGVLRFSEVTSFFHEFGHLVHHICNRASFTRFSGLCVDSDFVEIPALVLENWCYENCCLKLLSGFREDITRPITDQMCKFLKKRRYSFSALKLKQEILYCIFDQIIHSTENVDMVGLLRHLHPKVMLGLPMLEGTNPASCFPRMAIGYEAACYSRIWSEVFATDVFASKFHGAISNPSIGMEFRNKILAPGGAKDPVEMLRDFLGREPSTQAFIDILRDSRL